VRDGGITCHLCGMTSYNRDDIREHYCGNCKVFLDTVTYQEAQRLHKTPVVLRMPQTTHPSGGVYAWVAVVLGILALALFVLFWR